MNAPQPITSLKKVMSSSAILEKSKKSSTANNKDKDK
jgi:hypothetical protein